MKKEHESLELLIAGIRLLICPIKIQSCLPIPLFYHQNFCKFSCHGEKGGIPSWYYATVGCVDAVGATTAVTAAAVLTWGRHVSIALGEA